MTERKRFVINYNEKFEVNETLLVLLEEWMRNFKTNCESMKFQHTIHDLPRIRESALIVDHPFSGSFDRQVEDLKDYKGTIFCCDRALFQCLVNDIIPDYVVNVDSSYLCLAFYDLPIIRKYMDKITAIFAVTTFPLTIRAWTGRKAFFTPMMGDNRGLTQTLSGRSKTDIVISAGCVHNTSFALAYALGANTIGLYGIDNSYDKPSQAEHGIKTSSYYVSEIDKTFYTDEVYRLYANLLFQLIEHTKGEIELINTTENGIMYNSIAEQFRFPIVDIKKMPLKKFVEEYK